MKCPKCGSETGDYQRHLFGTNGGGAWCYKCNEYVHIQVRFTKCDHEEKVGGEKCPKCGSEMLYQTETLKRLLRWVCSNQDCRYEEKVGGEGK